MLKWYLEGVFVVIRVQCFQSVQYTRILYAGTVFSYLLYE